MSEVEVCETFVSIQGESTYAGLTCFFVRLSGCNLRCSYCDTRQAFGRGERRGVEVLVAGALRADTAICEITGGEPLLQEGFAVLAARLLDATHRPVLVETNGSCDISRIPEGVTAIVDIKTPGSGESARMDWGNLDRLRPCDEVKFVLTGRDDYVWACDRVRERNLSARCHAVHFSPAWGSVKSEGLAQWLLEDKLPVRLQLQLQKVLNLP